MAYRAAHPAEILRVIDGDTFEARVRVWPGLDITTKVRLRGIDAPELRAHCEGERVKDYPQLSIRLPAEVRAKLQALGVVSARSQWRLISEAIDCYLRGRPAGEKRSVERLLHSRRRRR